MIRGKKPVLADLHFEHKIWMNEIAFYKIEIKIFQERLEEIAKKNTSKEIHEHVEQFQNRFIIQNNEMDILIHKIKLIEHKEALKGEKLRFNIVDEKISQDHCNLKDETEQFTKLYKELKKDFYSFLVKCM
jgi:hypothetical protein